MITKRHKMMSDGVETEPTADDVEETPSTWEVLASQGMDDLRAAWHEKDAEIAALHAELKIAKAAVKSLKTPAPEGTVFDATKIAELKASIPALTKQINAKQSEQKRIGSLMKVRQWESMLVRH